MLIHRRELFGIVAGAALSALPACSGPGAGETPKRRPNIVFILADDLGYEAVGAYGGTSWKTPNLDALAAAGVRFDHAYAQPLCTPTRLQVMTGQYNFRNWKAFGILDPSETTFGHTLKEAGYKACISGKWQLHSYNPPEFEPEFRGIGMKPEDAGFDDWFLWHSYHTEDKGSRYPDPVIYENSIYDNGRPVKNTTGKYGPDLYTDRVCDFIEREAAADDPFFVYYPMALTHGPFNPTPDSADWSDTEKRFVSDEKYFGDMVEYCDKKVGRIVGKLDELGLRDNTLLIFFTDNGSPRATFSMMDDRRIQGGKGLTTDAGTRVPLIVSGWGVESPGRIHGDLIDSTDIYATILDAADAEPPAGKIIDGVSFLPQLGGEPGSPKDVILVWHDPRPGVGKERWTAVELFARDKRFKLYDDGSLYDVPEDILERNPIPPGEGTPPAEQARKTLRAALDRIPADKREPEWDPYGPFR